MVEAAAAAGLALIALHREIKFVSVTEEVHRRIIDDQTAALRARDEVRTLFTSLALRGAPADYVWNASPTRSARPSSWSRSRTR